MGEAYTFRLPLEHKPGSRSGFTELDTGLTGPELECLQSLLRDGKLLGERGESVFSRRVSLRQAGIDKEVYFHSAIPGIAIGNERANVLMKLHDGIGQRLVLVGFSGNAQIESQLSVGGYYESEVHADGLNLQAGMVRLAARIVLSFTSSTIFVLAEIGYPAERFFESDTYELSAACYYPDSLRQDVVQFAPGALSVWDQTQMVPHYASGIRSRLIVSVAELISLSEAEARARSLGLDGAPLTTHFPRSTGTDSTDSVRRNL